MPTFITTEEILRFTTTLFVMYTMAQAIAKHGGLQATIKGIRDADGANRLQSWHYILLGLLFPQALKAFYFLLLALPLPGFEQNVPLRQDIVTAYTVSENLILGIYYLNGRLIDIFFALWKRLPPIW